MWRDGENEREDKWRGGGGAMEINGGWSKNVRVRSALAFLTMCCIYCTLQQTVPPHPKRDCGVCMFGRDGGKKEKQDEGGRETEREAMSERSTRGEGWGEYC